MIWFDLLPIITLCGEWRSLVARLLWEQEVAGSNPVSPTRKVVLNLSENSGYISLYRRYRPQRFADVVGQDEIIRTLRNAVIAGQVAHAYLFSGERGIGKTTVARILARAVNCLHPEGGEPCNECANCKTILANRTLDILEIDGASNRGIDHIRRLRDEVAFAPTDLKTKVYIIDEVHMLTNEAFNALLKTLEEPPPHVVFIFATTEPHKVPRTIVSRCQAFDFRKLPQEKIAARLEQIARAEKIPIEPSALDLIARKANGGMRDAIVMLEQADSFRDAGKISATSLLDMLGLVGREEHAAFLTALEAGDRKKVLEMIDSLVSRGKDLEVFLGDLIMHLRNRIASASSPNEARDIRLVRGLLDIKQDLYRSLDRRIILEIGILALMQNVVPQTAAPQTAPASPPPAPTADAPPLIAAVETDTAAAETPAPAPRESAPKEEGGLNERWERMLEKIAQDRIAIAALLAEGTPQIDGNKLRIVFHPEYTFHKESLEKTDNMHYLAGMVHRYLGDEFTVEVNFDDNAVRKPSPREALREKAQLVCEVFDGKIVKEE